MGVAGRKRSLFENRFMPKRILLIDEDNRRRTITRRSLEAEHFEVIAFECGKDAARHLESHADPRVVVNFGSFAEPMNRVGIKGLDEDLMDLAVKRPLVLVCNPDDSLDYETTEVAAIILHRPVTTLQLKAAINTLLSKTVQESAMHRKRD
jgi:DNA-binding NtrC family response regulator